MTAPILDTSAPADTDTTGAINGDPSRDTTGSKDFVVGKTGFAPVKVTMAFAVTILIAILAIIAVAHVKDRQTTERLRQERIENAQRDLNNRIVEQSIGGSVTRVFYVGNEMRATWRSEDGLKRCTMRVVAPTDEVLRYSTADVEASDSSFRMLEDPNALGCITATAGGGIGGG